MSLIAYEDEVHTSISPEKLFKYFILEADSVLPKALPEAFKSIQNVQGDGQAGSVKLINYGEGLGHKTARHHIDEIDEVHQTFKYSVLEGHPLDEHEGLEKITNTVKIESGPHGGSICKLKTEFHVKEHHDVTEEKLKEGKEKIRAVIKAVEDHLHAHAHEYI